MMRTKVRTKDVPICDETPINRRLKATELQIKVNGEILGSRY